MQYTLKSSLFPQRDSLGGKWLSVGDGFQVGDEGVCLLLLLVLRFHLVQTHAVPVRAASVSEFIRASVLLCFEGLISLLLRRRVTTTSPLPLIPGTFSLTWVMDYGHYWPLGKEPAMPSGDMSEAQPHHWQTMTLEKGWHLTSGGDKKTIGTSLVTVAPIQAEEDKNLKWN